MSAYPINQVFLGNDPLVSGITDIDTQIQMLKSYEERLKSIRDKAPLAQDKQVDSNTIWNKIDSEIAALSDQQKTALFNDSEYIEINNKLQTIVQNELLNLVKYKIEKSDAGKNLLEKQYEVIKRLKNKIIDESKRDMELLRRFKEESKKNPNLTYNEFILSNTL